MLSITSVLKTIIALGAVQGLVAGVLLFWNKRQKKANRILAFMLWFFSLACINLRLFQESVLYTTTLGGIIDAFVPLTVVMPMGPLLYFYIRASLEPDFRLRPYRNHFYSVVLDVLPQIAAVIYIGGVLLGLIKKAIPLDYYRDVYNIYVDIPRWLSLTIYLWLSARYLAALPASVPQNQGEETQHSMTLRWLRQFVRAFLVMQSIWLIYLIPYVIPRFSNRLLQQLDWYPVYVPLAVLIYWLGIKALLVTYKLPVAIRKTTTTVGATVIPADTLQQTIAVLKKAMEQEQLYLDPSLNLTSLSQHTGIAAKTISAVLNQHLHTSFNEYVNQYRITEFKKRVLEADLQHLTITGIAFDCGFNSQATFQRVFKQVTGMSPTEYRKASVEKPL